MSRFLVRLTPSGEADRIDGRSTDADGNVFLKVRVRAAPENNETKALGVAKRKVNVAPGHTTRLKTLDIEGLSAADLGAFVAKFEETP